MFVDHSFAQIKKEINEIGLSGKIAQGKWAVKIVKELLDKSPLEMAKTAIVLPNEQLASLVGPMITYLLPLLIGFTGGKLVGGDRGAVAGAVTTMGVIVGADIPMFMGAMIVGPLGGTPSLPR